MKKEGGESRDSSPPKFSATDARLFPFEMQDAAIVIANESGMEANLSETASGHRSVLCEFRKIFRLIRNYGSMTFNLVNRIRIKSRNQEEGNPVTELDGGAKHKDNRLGTVFRDILVDCIRMFERACQTVKIAVVNHRTKLFVEIDVRADFRNFLIGALAERLAACERAEHSAICLELQRRGAVVHVAHRIADVARSARHARHVHVGKAFMKLQNVKGVLESIPRTWMFKSYMQEHFPETDVRFVNYEDFDEILTASPFPDAIWAPRSGDADFACSRLRELGIRVPEQLSFLSTDLPTDLPYQKLSNLDTVYFSTGQVAELIRYCILKQPIQRTTGHITMSTEIRISSCGSVKNINTKGKG